MKIQVRCLGDKLSSEQQILEDRTYEAAKILKAAGFQVEVALYVVTSPKDSPAAIHIVSNNRTV